MAVHTWAAARGGDDSADTGTDGQARTCSAPMKMGGCMHDGAPPPCPCPYWAGAVQQFACI